MSDNQIEKEFEDFVYIVSHDMAAPQRHIREFTKLLLGSIDVPLSDEQKTYYQFIESGLGRLEKMQAALLDFSRITTQGAEFESFDSVACINRVLQKLSGKICDKAVEIDCPSTLIPVMGDEEQIGTVFYHLIDNALTYNENAHPHIRISAVVKGDRVEWSVEDNGIGIANGHGEHIFTMFRRLHSADAYGGGVGAGLALARKIIRRHGGELNYQSENGRGAIFQFSLPVAE